mmetsp:Transcript_75448/g.133567  ORF Transcript_75448/g.133567 Transcript_75448/m.133567 type:complete len:88 (+) Transcript_75448:745-1008(+)
MPGRHSRSPPQSEIRNPTRETPSRFEGAAAAGKTPKPAIETAVADRGMATHENGKSPIGRRAGCKKLNVPTGSNEEPSADQSAKPSG